MNSSIIIPTFQGKHLLPRLLGRLLNSKDSRFVVTIVDNGSTDGTADFVKKEYPQIHLIELDRNYGFTKAVNIGVKAADSEYVLILNNDCLIKPEDIKKLEEFVVTHDLVATQPVVWKDKNIENSGYMVDLKKGKAEMVTELDSMDPSVTSFPQDDSGGQMWEKGKMYGLSATCLLIKRDIFLELGGFEESFHSYLEDVDLFIRLEMKGYRFAPCLLVSVVHEHMATSSRMGAYKEQHDLTNWIRIILKNYPRSFILHHFPTLFVERLRNVSGLVKKLVTIYL